MIRRVQLLASGLRIDHQRLTQDTVLRVATPLVASSFLASIGMVMIIPC